jgi:hypothetical protein
MAVRKYLLNIGAHFASDSGTGCEERIVGWSAAVIVQA